MRRRILKSRVESSGRFLMEEGKDEEREESARTRQQREGKGQQHPAHGQDAKEEQARKMRDGE